MWAGVRTYNPPTALHDVVVLLSMTLNLLLTAVFKKQRQIYPSPKDLGQASAVTDFSS